MALTPLCSYRIDADARIEWVDDGWDRFIEENAGAPALTRERVIGTSLWDWLTGAETKHLYTLLVARVRKTQRAVTLPFCCDAPHLRRDLELTMSPTKRGVAFHSRLRQMRTRAPANLLDARAARSDELLRMCSVCKRVAAPGDRWEEVEDTIARLELFDAPTMPQISHGLCEPCFESAMRQVGSDAPAH
jgi:hypothetical protein